jgi:hypothetical protein
VDVSEFSSACGIIHGIYGRAYRQSISRADENDTLIVQTTASKHLRRLQMPFAERGNHHSYDDGQVRQIGRSTLKASDCGFPFPRKAE